TRVIHCHIYRSVRLHSPTILYDFYSSRRRHTISKRHWSSDVCSSDLSSAAQRWMFPWRKRLKLPMATSSQAMAKGKASSGSAAKIGRAAGRGRGESGGGVGTSGAYRQHEHG